MELGAIHISGAEIIFPFKHYPNKFLADYDFYDLIASSCQNLRGQYALNGLCGIKHIAA
jgi:hypothetical protein